MMLDANTRYTRCEALIVDVEGGYVCDPRDPGGATNHGITINTLSDYLGRRASVQEVKDLSLDTASKIYRKLFWGPADNLAAGIDLMYFNAAVNNGPGNAARFLQHACGAVEDGKIGPATMAKATATNPCILIDNFATAQGAFYRGLHNFPIYGKGWTNRLDEVHAQAIEWAKAK